MKEKAEKATLLGIATALIPWALQKALAAQYYTAGVALVAGLGALYAYEHLNLRQIPVSVSDLKDASEAVGDQLEDTVDKNR